MAPSARTPLDRDRIVRAAVVIADEHGAAVLSMRRLAEHIGCAPMSLYNHVATKDDLHALMVDAVAAEIAPPPVGIAPMAAVRHRAVATRDMFLAHPWAPTLWLRHLPGPARVRQMELLLDDLARSDLAPAVAHHGFHAVTNHVVGYSLQELELTMGGDDPQAVMKRFLADVDDGTSPHVAAHVRQHLDGDTGGSFELVLDLILDGLVRLDRSARLPADRGR